MSLVKLKKTDFIPFIDISETINLALWDPSWTRVDLSTIFSLNPNPQVNTMDYISYETPIDVVDRYQPELPQEIALYQGNPVYDYVFALFHALPTGSAANVPVLICFGGTDKLAWQVRNATLVLGELNPIDGKLSFTLKLGGDIDKGTYAIASGVPVFSASDDVIVSAVAWDVTAPVKDATPQATFDPGTGYTGAITWAPTGSTFAAETAYTATVVLTAASGYVFDPAFGVSDVTGRPASGFSVTRDSDTQVTLTAVYAATAA
jgi:hypothetical protein